jgi:hypothetical protein
MNPSPCAAGRGSPAVSSAVGASGLYVAHSSDHTGYHRLGVNLLSDLGAGR